MIRRRLAVLALTGLLCAVVGWLTPPMSHADPANKLELVLDASGSMKEKLHDGSTRIDAARAALGTVIDGLPADQQVAMRVFGATVFDKTDKGACTDSQRAVDLGTDNRQQLTAAVKRFKPYGETPTGYALQQAGRDLGTHGRRSIVLVSDGEPTCAPDPCMVAKSLAQHGIQLRIDVVGLDVSGKARAMLQCIARVGKGHYYDADDADDLARALDTVASRAARPYTLSGRPISGATSASASIPIGTGDWVDHLGGVGHEREELYFSLRRTMPQSTFHVSAALVNNSKEYDGLTVELFRDQTPCGADGQALDGSEGSIVSVAYAAPGPTSWNEACTSAAGYTLEISRGVNHGGNGLAKTVPVEIHVDEEAPADNTATLPQTIPEPTYHKINIDSKTKITGGNSFADSTLVTSGGYRGNIVPGELQLFEVPVDWGQHLSAFAQIPRLSGKVAHEMDDGGPSLNLRLFSPARAPAENLIKSKAYSTILTQGTEVHSITTPVVYQGRESNAERTAAASQAGPYYLALSVAQDDGKTYQLPFTIGISVDGRIQGEPDYRTQSGGSPPPSPSSVSTPSHTASDMAPSSAAPSNVEPGTDRPPTPDPREVSVFAPRTKIVALVSSGLALAAVIGCVVLTIRRHR